MSIARRSLLTGTIALAGMALAACSTTESERSDLDVRAAAARDELFRTVPAAKSLAEQSAGVLVFADALERAGSAESLARMNRGEAVPASDLYFRTTPVFETGSEKYAWLNRIVSVGIGAITTSGAELEVFQIL